MISCECGFSCLKNNMKRHKTSCVAREFVIRIQKLEKELESKNSDIQDLREQIRRLSSRPTTINYTNNVKNEFVFAFGNEPVPSTADVFKILYPPQTSVVKYIEMKHFIDPKTTNVRIRNKRSKTIQVWEADMSHTLRWAEKDRKETIERIVDDNLVELSEKHGASKMERWCRWYKSSGLQDPGYDKTDAYKHIIQDVECLLLTQMNK